MFAFSSSYIRYLDNSLSSSCRFLPCPSYSLRSENLSPKYSYLNSAPAQTMCLLRFISKATFSIHVFLGCVSVLTTRLCLFLKVIVYRFLPPHQKRLDGRNMRHLSFVTYLSCLLVLKTCLQFPLSAFPTYDICSSAAPHPLCLHLILLMLGRCGWCL